MKEDPFISAYKSLNSEQKKAVDAIEGPVMVIAGPGTGKTSILTLRIANILRKTDTTPDSILALTFTESAVYSMRKKLAELIGSRAYKVNIATFHSFCNDIIERYPEYFPRIIGGTPISEVDQVRIVENIFEENSFSIIKPFGNIFYYLRPAIQAIQALKRENIDPKEFTNRVKAEEERFLALEDLYHTKGKYKGHMKGIYKVTEKKIEKNKELAVVFEEYEKSLALEKKYDYEDMILEVIRVLEKENDLLLILQEEYHYILADEHQDANNAQNRILELLSSFHDSPNLFIVGDEKQAIYRFQGASLENFLYFKRKYPQALLLALEKNYRSTQIILDVAHSLIENNPVSLEALRIPLQGVSLEGPPVALYELKTKEEEISFLVENIKSRISSGVLPSEIAVLYRNNKDAIEISRLLEKFDIPFGVHSDEDVFHDFDIRKYIEILRAVHAYGKEQFIAPIMFFDCFGLPLLDVYRLISFASKERKNIYDFLSNPLLLKQAEITETTAFLNFGDVMKKWARLAKNKPLLEVLETILRESGFVESILSSKGSLAKIERMDGFLLSARELVQTKRGATLNDFIDFVDTLEVHNIKIRKKNRPQFNEAVSLMTAHKSKGLEFKVVYIVGLNQSVWGDKKLREHFSLPIFSDIPEDSFIEDERRLFYVALTRAKEEVVILYSRLSSNGKEELGSQFLDELRKDKLLKEKVSIEISFKDGIAPVSFPGISISDKKYLRSLFLEQGLNVTALNNFLECPWKYFFENLIRIPKTPEKSALFGVAVHSTLREALLLVKQGKKVEEREFLKIFERFLSREPLSPIDFKEALRKGKKALVGYRKKYIKNWGGESLPEVSIAGVFTTLVDGTKLLLRGQIDRVDLLEGSFVRVVDYKTGKPKSRNAILGETSDSEGNMKRQLDFYKLLLDLYEDGKYNMREGVIDFVEPTDRGDYKQEFFFFEDKDRSAIESLVKEIGNEIQNFTFWDKNCGKKDCKFCELRKSLHED